MDFVLCGLSCLVYLDDIIIFGKSFEEQLARLLEGFSRIRSPNLELKPTKCSLFRRSVSFVGHIVSSQGMSVQTEKVQAIRDWPPCQTLTELRAFLVTCGYYRRFVKDFSTVASPFYALTQKGAKYEWTPDCQRAFEAPKLRLLSEPILDVGLPSDRGTFILDCDASNYALWAVLSQVQSGI